MKRIKYFLGFFVMCLLIGVLIYSLAIDSNAETIRVITYDELTTAKTYIVDDMTIDSERFGLWCGAKNNTEFEYYYITSHGNKYILSGCEEVYKKVNTAIQQLN